MQKVIKKKFNSVWDNERMKNREMLRTKNFFRMRNEYIKESSNINLILGPKQTHFALKSL